MRGTTVSASEVAESAAPVPLPDVHRQCGPSPTDFPRSPYSLGTISGSPCGRRRQASCTLGPWTHLTLSEVFGSKRERVLATDPNVRVSSERHPSAWRGRTPGSFLPLAARRDEVMGCLCGNDSPCFREGRRPLPEWLGGVRRSARGRDELALGKHALERWQFFLNPNDTRIRSIIRASTHTSRSLVRDGGGAPPRRRGGGPDGTAVEFAALHQRRSGRSGASASPPRRHKPAPPP